MTEGGIPLSQVRSIFVRSSEGALIAAYYPNNLGSTVDEMIQRAWVRAEEIGGEVQINWVLDEF